MYLQLDDTHVVLGRLVSGAMHLEALGSVPTDESDRPVRRVHVHDCGAISGWNRPPMPLPRERGKRAGTVGELADETATRRSAVAESVAAALASSSGGGGGGKRVAEGASAAEPAAKRAPLGGMMALPFASEMGEEDDSDDDEEEEEEEEEEGGETGV